LSIQIGDHCIADDDIAEVTRRLNQIALSVGLSDEEKEQEKEKVLDDYDSCKNH
jgi:hypothetical protein